MTTNQELQVRRVAAAHLSGIPARQNANSVARLEDLVCTRIAALIGAGLSFDAARAQALAE